MGQPCPRWAKAERLTWVQDSRKTGQAGGQGSRLRSHSPSGTAAGSSDRRMSPLLQENGKDNGEGPAGLSLLLTSLSGLGPGLNLAVYAQVLGQTRLPVLLPPFPALMAGGYSTCSYFLFYPSCCPFPRDGNGGMIWRLETGQNRVASWTLPPQSVMLRVSLGRGAGSGLETQVTTWARSPR